MAVGDAYETEEGREGEGLDEVAYRTERITRRHCRAVSEFAFRHAERMWVKIFGGPKYTVSPVYEGMLKEELDAAAARYPAMHYEPQLINATYALLLTNAGDGMVIPALNRGGDCLDEVIRRVKLLIAHYSLLIDFVDVVRVAFTNARRRNLDELRLGLEFVDGVRAAIA
jgi:hypothetical protein